MVSVKKELKRRNIFPRRRLGQNFLIDKAILKKIIMIAELNKEDIVIEIGAGWGNLSSSLAKEAKKVYAVEIDRGLYSLLQEKLAGLTNIEIMNEDALELDYQIISRHFGKKVKVIANLPYSISTPIIFNLLDSRAWIDSMVLMLQKEVAHRIIAPFGTKEYGILAIFIQMYCDTSLEISVPSSAFHPRPKVESAVVKFKVLDGPRVTVTDEAYFKKMVKAVFAQRRKTLVNTLKNAPYLNLTRSDILSALNSLGIDPKRRGETLTLDDYGRLSNRLIFLGKQEQ